MLIVASFRELHPTHKWARNYYSSYLTAQICIGTHGTREIDRSEV